jgi:hypothetical protein
MEVAPDLQVSVLADADSADLKVESGLEVD